MIWYFSAYDHDRSIHPFTVWWLSHGLIKRFVAVLIPTWLLSVVFFALAAAARSNTVVASILVVCGLLGWAFVPLDAWYQRRVLKHDARSLTNHGFRQVRLARYRGGHGRLMHQRFVYLALGGSKRCPFLCIIFPCKRQHPPDGPTFVLPEELFLVGLLDFKTSKTARATDMGDDDSELLATIATQRPGLLTTEVVLQVHYIDGSNREQVLELSHFDSGNSGVQEWRNALTCARTEADRGVAPRQPWSPLPDMAVGAQYSAFKRALERDGLVLDDDTRD